MKEGRGKINQVIGVHSTADFVHKEYNYYSVVPMFYAFVFIYF